MSDIEHGTSPLLRPLMVSSLCLSLPRARQAEVASWAFLRLLVFQRAKRAGPDTVPASHYAYFHEHRQPPQAVQIWTGRRLFEKVGHLLYQELRKTL
jgi:hypothetical protein